LARKNLNDPYERLRISWQNKYGIPTHQRWEDYTPEEAVLEAWEQHLYENPKSLEAHGIDKAVNQETGEKYYITGDPVIDELERAFGRGEDPDLNAAFSGQDTGVDISRLPLWVDDGGSQHVPNTQAPRFEYNEHGEKVSDSGGKVDVANFQSDDWVKQALDDDPILKNLASRWGIDNGGHPGNPTSSLEAGDAN